MHDIANLEAELDTARRLVSALESGDENEARKLIEVLSGLKYQSLLTEVGRLTREVNDSIKLLSSDERLITLTQDQIPDCQERLQYVIQQTEKAANDTLDAVEDMMSRSKTISEDAHTLLDQTVPTTAAADATDRTATTVFATNMAENGEYFHARLSDVLVAQSYQDLTSQVIRRTIDVVTQIEGKLLEIVAACRACARRRECAGRRPGTVFGTGLQGGGSSCFRSERSRRLACEPGRVNISLA